MIDFQGKNIWLLGASSGIGHALALELHRRGANLVLSARSTEKLEALNAQMQNQHSVCALDVADTEQVATAFETVKKNCQKLIA